MIHDSHKGKGKARHNKKGKGKAEKAKREKGKGRHPLGGSFAELHCLGSGI